MNDLRLAVRQFLKRPGFTATVVLTLALGISATSAVFALVHGILLTPPPMPEPQQLVIITPEDRESGSRRHGVHGKQWIAWQKEAKSFQAMAGYGWDFCFLLQPDGSESIRGQDVTVDFFRVLGIKPMLGRDFVEADAPAPSPDSFPTVILLGHSLWKRKFNSDPTIIGQKIRVRHNASPPLTLTVTVAGVMPPGIRFLPSPGAADGPNFNADAQVDYWFPVGANPEASWWNVVARLRDDVELPEAQAELTTFAARQAQTDVDLKSITARVQPLTTVLNAEVRRYLLPLFGAVVLVFLIACSNVAGLLLARGLQRHREYAVRCALGARRAHLFRQLLSESLLLGALAGSAATGLTFLILELVKQIGGFAIPRLDAVTINWPTLVFGIAMTTLAVGLATLLPALRSSRIDLEPTLRNAGTTTSASRQQRRLLRAVTIFQTALTLALLAGAGLLLRTANNLARVQPGYDTEKILTMSVTTMADAKDYIGFHVQSLARLTALPGVKAAAFGWGLPLTGNKFENTRVTVEGQPQVSKLIANGRAVTPDYFNVLGIPLLAGRGFRATDNWNNWKSIPKPAPGETPFVAIINQAMAEKYFPGTDPIGKTVRGFPFQERPCEIIGVVADTRTEALNRDAQPEIYWCYWQIPPFTKHLVIRTSSEPRALIAATQRELRAVDPTASIEQIKTLAQIRRESVAPQHFAMQLLTASALVSCTLALIGIYGVLSLSVGSRRREIAIRTVVGARKGDVLCLVLREGLQLLAIGLLVGLGLTVVFSRALATFLFGVEPTDPVTLGAAALLFSAVTLLACWLPARRATKVDPMEALRHE